MNYDFTPGVRRALGAAKEEALALAHDYIGTEHILLGLISSGDQCAGTVIGKLGFAPTQIRDRVSEVAPKGTGLRHFGDLPYRSEAKRVLEGAMAEARGFGHSHVGTEHLILGLLGVERGVAFQVLSSLGATPETMRKEALTVLGLEDFPRDPMEDSVSGLVDGIETVMDGLRSILRALKGPSR
jgi:ATP-dependent Clp protease ATP-binding subunit ClpC